MYRPIGCALLRQPAEFNLGHAAHRGERLRRSKGFTEDEANDGNLGARRSAEQAVPHLPLYPS